jgi:hypothetical protein
MWAAAPSEPSRDWVPVPSGENYRIVSPPENAMVTRELAEELRRALDRFGGDARFTRERPVRILFKPGVVGHHQVGRAADIYEVEGMGLERWKARWDAASDSEKERRENLGWRLYKALQQYGRWSQPYGYPIQLFGPWTRSEGPWKYISDRLLKAHADHIHVAK